MTQSENAIKWLDALLSGKYKQGTGSLGDSERGFCCWGLGCSIVGLTYNRNEDWNAEFYDIVGFNNRRGMIRPIYLSQIGIPFQSLIGLNDGLRLSFTEIAEYLILNAATNFKLEVAEAIKKHYETSTINIRHSESAV